MSRGPGRIERAIEDVLDDEPNNAFTVEDLCRRAYSRVNRIEKKHRVAVLRAARNLAMRRDTLCSLNSENLGGTLVYYDGDNVLSYAMARLKANNLNGYSNNDARSWRRSDEANLRAMLAEGGDHHKYVVEGGAWWKHVQWWIEEREARRTGDTKRLERVLAEQDEYNAKVFASLSSAFGGHK